MNNKKTRDSYHHKNLKEEIIQATLEYIEQWGHESLSLRHIASKIGVAHTAIYHHYKNKNDLLADVAVGQFRKFVEDAKAKNERSKYKSYAQLFNYGEIYIEFALKHANVFRLILGRHPFDLTQYPELITVSAEALQYLIELVKKCQDDRVVKKGDALKISLGIWSISHGYATLLIDNRIDTLKIYGFKPDFSARELTEFIFDLLKNGLLIDTKRFFLD